MDFFVSAFSGVIGAIIGSLFTSALSKKDWKQRQLSDAYSCFFEKMIRSMSTLSQSDLIELRCNAARIAIYTDEETASKFLEATRHIEHNSLQTEAFASLLDDLYSIAKKSMK